MSSTQKPVAIVTGASSGIGLGITLALIEHGYRVVGTSRTISKSRELKASADLVLIDGEISKKETAVKIAQAAIKHFGRIDLLVNNAGIFIPKPFTEYTEDDYNLVMNTNVASFFFMTQQVIPQMKKQNSGHVVSISAVVADQPSGNFPAVLAVLSKSTMPAVSKALALEYAANDIRFNTVSPGNINTPMHANDNHAALAKFHPLALVNLKSYPKWQQWLRDHQPPLLVLWGRYDTSFTVAGGEAYRRDDPHAEVHILDAGHFALDLKAQEIIRLTEAFLDKQQIK